MIKGKQLNMVIVIDTKEEFDKKDTPMFKIPEDVLYYRIYNSLEEVLSVYKVEYGKQYNVKVIFEIEEI